MINLLTYCVVAVESVGRQLPIAFLERIKDDFTKKYSGGKAATAVASSLNREFGSKLKEQMQYCVDHPEEISKLAKVKAQVSEVKGVMMENIEKVLDRGEKIELLVDKTENLRSQDTRNQHEEVKECGCPEHAHKHDLCYAGMLWRTSRLLIIVFYQSCPWLQMHRLVRVNLNASAELSSISPVNSFYSCPVRISSSTPFEGAWPTHLSFGFSPEKTAATGRVLLLGFQDRNHRPPACPVLDRQGRGSESQYSYSCRQTEPGRIYTCHTAILKNNVKPLAYRGLCLMKAIADAYGGLTAVGYRLLYSEPSGT
ncbi:UNVERIFIED_CONTAM: Vesicle-associated membrane protein [Sesamum calycinum]|uniref:Vesicle-associated membrane protein n=1 Tax=Sesamum calycinum TaxID=2727403 RepID=A0AAW2JKD8_9LAMI